MLKNFRNSLIAGIIIILPLTVTIFVISFLIKNIGTPVSELIFKPLIKENFEFLSNSIVGKTLLDIIATLLVLILITVLGFFSKFFLGRYAISVFETAVEKIPVAKQIYKTVKQIVDTFSKQNKSVFQKVVLVKFPHQDSYSIGFLTGYITGEILEHLDEKRCNIFVPTTPNPTSGFFLIVKESELIFLEMTVSEGMKLLISGGAVAPEWHKK